MCFVYIKCICNIHFVCRHVRGPEKYWFHSRVRKITNEGAYVFVIKFRIHCLTYTCCYLDMSHILVEYIWIRFKSCMCSLLPYSLTSIVLHSLFVSDYLKLVQLKYMPSWRMVFSLDQLYQGSIMHALKLL